MLSLSLLSFFSTGVSIGAGFTVVAVDSATTGFAACNCASCSSFKANKRCSLSTCFSKSLRRDLTSLFSSSRVVAISMAMFTCSVELVEPIGVSVVLPSIGIFFSVSCFGVNKVSFASSRLFSSFFLTSDVAARAWSFWSSFATAAGVLETVVDEDQSVLCLIYSLLACVGLRLSACSVLGSLSTAPFFKALIFSL